MAPIKVPVAELVLSAPTPKEWPPDGPPEIAACGRSNVGKSSLLNVLLARKSLVRTSRTPGRTRLVNFFRVEILDGGVAPRELRFVDLPGFGYAKVSKTERSTWREGIERYLSDRRSLRVVVLLMDARRGPELDEHELAPWIESRGVKLVPVLTKIDKLSKHERRPTQDRVTAALGVKPLLFSATTGEGREELWAALLAAL